MLLASESLQNCSGGWGMVGLGSGRAGADIKRRCEKRETTSSPLIEKRIETCHHEAIIPTLPKTGQKSC